METQLYVSVDRSRCCGYMICNEICPEIYGIDDQGFAVVSEEPVPAELHELALEGAEACPERAILCNGEAPA